MSLDVTVNGSCKQPIISTAENHSDHLIRNNPVIKKLTKIIPRDDGIQLNPRFAYISELNHARLVMNMIENYDVEAAKPSHVVLRDVNLGHNIRFYRLFYPSQLFDRLRQTMQIFYEAGLRDHWSQRVEHHFTTKSQRNISFIFQEPVKKFGLADLEPAWLALTIGSATGTPLDSREIWSRHPDNLILEIACYRHRPGQTICLQQRGTRFRMYLIMKYCLIDNSVKIPFRGVPLRWGPVPQQQ
ncbi:conserved hypothetical protein [Culex quinquefasciatus]|uniref:Uncharacterized protein n=1 Tax=Culex quinquefasciatus TaxID=7176 RepID=B0WC07_CULQU|nr:conserved hypothetical protein [Culex quinquefasciatus]|eukprot:XP_001846241.1 conserved hypothetical protein [Culex quinquefasciatus]